MSCATLQTTEIKVFALLGCYVALTSNNQHCILTQTSEDLRYAAAEA
jgi:hypothetical protein